MKLYQYEDALNEKDIKCITDAYHHIYIEPISDEIIEADDSLIIPTTYGTVAYEDLDKIELPKKIKKGKQSKFVLNKTFVEEVISGDFMTFRGGEGCFSKIVIELQRNEPLLMRLGEVILALEKYLRPGGKIILYKKK